MKGCNGFSIMELVIVIALFTMIMGISISYGTFIYRIAVKQEAEKIAIICRYLQYSAMVCNKAKVLVFDLKKRSYMYDGNVESLPSSVNFGVLDGVKGPPANPIRQIRAPVTFESERIIFHPDGIIQPGTVYLIGKDKHVMYALSSPVSQFSFVRIYRYDGSWQCLS